MRKLFLGLAISLVVGTPSSAMAAPKPFGNDLDKLFGNSQSSEVIKMIEPQKVEAIVPAPVKPPEAVVYVVVGGDNLTKIGTAHNVEWQRLWAKNANISHPDVIHIGDKLTIPVAGEVIPARELPAVVAAPVVTPGVSVPPAQAAAPVQKPVQSVGNYDSGNTYSPGYCTWYVKNRRGASLPNSLGNANTWFSRAQAMGMATGYAPRAGAVGTTTRGALGHVVYVESVNADGTVNISEMNYKGFNITSSRTTSASEFVYIY